MSVLSQAPPAEIGRIIERYLRVLKISPTIEEWFLNYGKCDEQCFLGLGEKYGIDAKTLTYLGIICALEVAPDDKELWNELENYISSLNDVPSLLYIFSSITEIPSQFRNGVLAIALSKMLKNWKMLDRSRIDLKPILDIPSENLDEDTAHVFSRLLHLIVVDLVENSMINVALECLKKMEEIMATVSSTAKHYARGLFTIIKYYTGKGDKETSLFYINQLEKLSKNFNNPEIESIYLRALPMVVSINTEKEISMEDVFNVFNPMTSQDTASSGMKKTALLDTACKKMGHEFKKGCHSLDHVSTKQTHEKSEHEFTTLSSNTDEIPETQHPMSTESNSSSSNRSNSDSHLSDKGEQNTATPLPGGGSAVNRRCEDYFREIVALMESGDDARINAMIPVLESSAESSFDYERVLEFYALYSVYKINKEDISAGREYLEKIEKLKSKVTKNTAVEKVSYILLAFANYYLKRGEMNSAMQYYEESLKMLIDSDYRIVFSTRI
ncbi:MAG: hypothetical protein QXL15_03775, partial [Candidatus Korarchaeota archaeon]